MLSNLAVVALAAAGAVNAGPLRRQATSAVESASSIASEASSAASSAVSSVVSGASSTAASEASGASSTAAGKSFHQPRSPSFSIHAVMIRSTSVGRHLWWRCTSEGVSCMLRAKVPGTGDYS